MCGVSDDVLCAAAGQGRRKGNEMFLVFEQVESREGGFDGE